MTDPYRYLPCGLDEALDVPDGFVSGSTPGPFMYRSDIEADVIDLANPHGWDHAVRAYVAICGGTCEESASVDFGWQGANGWGVRLREFWTPPHSFPGLRTDLPADRREALCRCICAALGLDVGVVFP